MQAKKFTLAPFAFLVTASLAALGSGCTTQQTVVPGPSAAPAPTPASAPAALCGVPTGANYMSVKEGVCNGAACRWRVTLRPAAGDSVEFTWYYQGQNRVGSCQCGGGDALSCKMNSPETFAAQWDTKKSVLLWGGEEYNPASK